MRFGLPSQDFNITDSQCYVRDLKGKSEKHLRAYASLFVQHLCEPGDPNSKTFEDGVPKEGLNVNQVLARIGMVSLIRKKVHEYEDKHGLTSVKKIKKLEEKKVIDLGNTTSKEFAMFEDNQNSVTEDGIQKDNNEEKKASDKETEKSENENKDQKNNETSDETKEVDEKMDVEKCDESGTKQEDNKEAKHKNDSTNETKTKESIVKPEEKESQKSEDNKLSENEVNDLKVEEKDKNVEKVKDSEDKEENIEKDENKNVEKKENDLEEKNKEVENEQKVQTFDFNIRDGGLTELHTLWFFEEQELKPGKEVEIWHKRHDYWLLAAIVKHGYERWKEVHEDEDFSILNEPFKNSIHIKNKFMERRLRLLEQALVFEEQFRRTAHLTRISAEDKEKDEEEDEEEVKEETNDENKPINPTVQKCINHYEELLTDMKSDCGRIPQTVQRIPPIAQRLQISQKGFNAIGQQKRQLSL